MNARLVLHRSAVFGWTEIICDKGDGECQSFRSKHGIAIPHAEHRLTIAKANLPDCADRKHFPTSAAVFDFFGQSWINFGMYRHTDLQAIDLDTTSFDGS